MKMTKVEALEAILTMLNKMNLSLSDAMSKLGRDYSILEKLIEQEGGEFNKTSVFSNLNDVMNGITSMTSIYSEAVKKATEGDENNDAVTKMQIAAAAINSGKDAIVGSIVKAIDSVGKMVDQEPNDLKEKSDSNISTSDNGQLAQLIGENGLLFRNLSPNVHSFGKGTIQPSERFPTFYEDVTVVPVSELSDYPEGFYDVKDNKPNQLFLRFGNLSYLWLFNSEHKELLILNNSEWVSVLTVPIGTVKIITQMLSVHFQTLHLR
jgi:hypothetical protein